MVNGIQLTSIGQVTRDELLSKYKHQLNNGQTNSDRSQDIINILGGIDTILLNYLSCENIMISNTEIQKLNVIITSKNDNNSPQKNVPYYYFNKTNTFLHSFFGESLGSKLHTYVYSKYCLVFIGILSIMHGIFWYCLKNKMYYFVFSCIFFPIAIIFNLFIILSVNRTGFYHMIRSFEFHLKVLYSFQFGICVILYHLMFNENIVWSNYMVSASNLMLTISVIQLIVIYSLLDGIQTKLWAAVLLGGVQSVVWIYNAYVYSFIHNVNGEEGLIRVTKEYSVSLYALLGASSRILCIFILKQTLMTIFRPNKCVNIKDTPKIKWIDENNQNDTDSDDQLL